MTHSSHCVSPDSYSRLPKETSSLKAHKKRKALADALRNVEQEQTQVNHKTTTALTRKKNPRQTVTKTQQVVGESVIRRMAAYFICLICRWETGAGARNFNGWLRDYFFLGLKRTVDS